MTASARAARPPRDKTRRTGRLVRRLYLRRSEAMFCILSNSRVELGSKTGSKLGRLAAGSADRFRDSSTVVAPRRWSSYPPGESAFGRLTQGDLCKCPDQSAAPVIKAALEPARRHPIHIAASPIGCGRGSMAYARKIPFVTILSPSETMLRRARVLSPLVPPCRQWSWLRSRERSRRAGLRERSAEGRDRDAFHGQGRVGVRLPGLGELAVS